MSSRRSPSRTDSDNERPPSRTSAKPQNTRNKTLRNLITRNFSRRARENKDYGMHASNVLSTIGLSNPISFWKGYPLAFDKYGRIIPTNKVSSGVISTDQITQIPIDIDEQQPQPPLSRRSRRSRAGGKKKRKTQRKRNTRKNKK